MKLHYDFGKTVGTVKPMHGVGQPPFHLGNNGFDDSMLHYLTDANIPYSRLHDVYGYFGGGYFVDTPIVFRDFSADENDPASYDFAFTDVLMTKLKEYGVEPYYRLGVTIENPQMIKAYNIFPPKDFGKWARICEHIIRHYNEGWADGYHLGVTYWEIWNEPDNEEDIRLNNMWKGTAEQYYDLYAVTAKHLEKCFGDSIKIGGFANTGLYLGYLMHEEKYKGPHEPDHWEERAIYHTKFAKGFLERIKRDNLKFDFFSHHSYMDVEKTKQIEACAEKMLSDYGFDDVEIHINEWNTDRTADTRGTTKASADVTAMMIAMQAMKTSVMCYYDARHGLSVYGGLFEPLSGKPTCTCYAFGAFGKLYALKNQVETTGAGEGVYTMAATDGKTRAVLLTNIGEKTVVTTDLGDGYDAYLIDEKHFMTPKKLNVKRFTLAKYETLYLEKKPEPSL